MSAQVELRTERIVYRPSPRGWIQVALSVFGAALFFAYALYVAGDAGEKARSDGPIHWFLFAGGVLMLLMGVFLALSLAWSRVVVEPDGLRWRTIGDWRFAAWDDLTELRVNWMSVEGAPVIFTKHGNIDLSMRAPMWPALRDAVAERSGQAWINLEKPAPAPPKPVDLPRTWRYDARRAHRGLWMPFLLFNAVMGPLFFSGAGARRDPLMIAFVLAAMQHLPALIVFTNWPRARAIQPRRDDEIYADANGITFSGRERRIQARWDEVQELYVAPLEGRLRVMGRYVVVTSRGEWDFVGCTETRTLQRLLAERAVNAEPPRWHARDDVELLGGDASLWSSGVPGVGERVFHYRFRALRVVLFTWAVFLSLPGLAAFAIPLFFPTLHPSRPDASLFAMSCLIWLGALALWFLARRVEVRASEHELRLITPWKTRVVAWENVESVRLLAFPSWFVVRAGRERLVFSALFYGSGTFKREVETRAVNAQIVGWSREEASPS